MRTNVGSFSSLTTGSSIPMIQRAAGRASLLNKCLAPCPLNIYPVRVKRELRVAHVLLRTKRNTKKSLAINGFQKQHVQHAFALRATNEIALTSCSDSEIE